MSGMAGDAGASVLNVSFCILSNVCLHRFFMLMQLMIRFVLLLLYDIRGDTANAMGYPVKVPSKLSCQM